MILSFSTKINEKTTYFVEKIWRGLLNKNFNLLAYHRFKDNASDEGVLDDWNWEKDLNPKLHTIREDKNNRWKVGTKIDFFINVRQKNMFRFAPVLPVLGIQKIEIIYLEIYPVLKIDGKLMYNSASGYNKEEMLTFAQNDGFDTIEDFFSYFDKPFIGKLIHWTNKKY